MHQFCICNDLGDACDSYNRTLLHHSSKNRQWELTRLLIRRGCNVDAQDDDGMTPLMHAVLNCDVDTVRILVDARADVYIENNLRLNVLQMAFTAEVSERRILLHLLSRVQSISFTNEEIALRLVAANCPLDRAVFLRNTAVIRRMIELGVDVDEKNSHVGSTALFCAAMECNSSVVKLLLKHKANVNAVDANGFTAVGSLHACRCKCDRCFGQFREKLGVLRILIDAGAALTSTSSVGSFQVRTILQQGSGEAVGIILRSIVDFAVRDSHGLSLLDYVVHNTNKDVVEKLRPYIGKFDVNTFDSLGKCPLLRAVECENINAVKLLLDNGANVNCAEKEIGATPLFKCFPASRAGDERNLDECVAMLLEYGAYPQVVCNNEDAPTIIDVGMITNRFYRMQLVIARLAMMLREGVPLIEMTRLKIDKCEIYKRYFGLCQLALQENYGSVDLFELLTMDEGLLEMSLNDVECLRKLMLLSDNVNMQNSHVYYYNVLKKRIAKVLCRHPGACECVLPFKLEISRMLEMKEKILATHLRRAEFLRNLLHTCYHNNAGSPDWMSSKKRMVKIIRKTNFQDEAAVAIGKIFGRRLDRCHIVMNEILMYLDDESLEVLSRV